MEICGGFFSTVAPKTSLMESPKTFGVTRTGWSYAMLSNGEGTPSPQIGKARVNFPAEMLEESENYGRPSLMSRRNRSMSAWSDMSSSWKLDER
ncbi:hypothetical protein GWI33_001969 [Rhynchophorus ferrugineus]|uniref:Uncharacterized protein n=1 Tax=Rhynchophorus ferrugineus TaxID=354439 RepID=A0A834INF8_RHYFE|nr:hypothetical protein GWI33_001969 [Rhynchophorus ferrugineus]